MEDFLQHKQPFKSYKIDDGKPKDVFTVRVNSDERRMLEELKEDLNIKSDSKALKIGALVGRNVLHSIFTRSILRYLFKKDRKKLDEYRNF